MSEAETQELNKSIPVSFEKAKVGPLTKRHVNGGFQSVERERDGVKRMAVLGLDNSHSGDYKVGYASDSLLVIKPCTDGVTHDELRELLETNGLWKEELTPIDIPTLDRGTPTYKRGFKSLPQSANQLGLYRSCAENAVQRDTDVLGGENGFTAYLPVE